MPEQTDAVPGAQPLPVCRVGVPGPCLGGIELADGSNELRGRLVRCARLFRQHVLGLDEVAPTVHPASKVHQAMGRRDGVVHFIAIRHQHSAFGHAGIELDCLAGSPTGRVAEQAHLRPRTIHLRPQIAFGLPPGLVP